MVVHVAWGLTDSLSPPLADIPSPVLKREVTPLLHHPLVTTVFLYNMCIDSANLGKRARPARGIITVIPAIETSPLAMLSWDIIGFNLGPG